jgi:hypothetical protein
VGGFFSELLGRSKSGADGRRHLNHEQRHHRREHPLAGELQQGGGACPTGKRHHQHARG